MGTQFQIICYAADSAVAVTAADSAFGRIEEINSIMSDYEPESELNQLSQTAGTGEWVSVSQPLFEVLEQSQIISKETDGAFDITIGPFTELWRGLNRQLDPELPEEEELHDLAAKTGYDYLKINKENHSVMLEKEGMLLNLGGIAKGYAIEEALDVLKQFEIESALINGGGDIAVGNAPPEKSAWDIQIDWINSKGENDTITIPLKNTFIATSGDLFQYVEIDDTRYSHIIDPSTGLGTTFQSRVTVTGPGGMQADAYASALSILPPEEGIKLMESKSEFAAFVVRSNGSVRSWQTKNFKELLNRAKN